MSKLTKYKFSDLYEMSSGISSSKEQAGHGSPFISFSTVFNNYFLPEELPDLMDTSLKEQEIFSVKKDDVFITRTSETVDALAMSCVAVKDYVNDFTDERRHHEIYLSDPRKVAPEKCKTVIRHPIKKA